MLNNKLDVTLSVGPKNLFKSVLVASEVLSTNLIRNKKLKINYDFISQYEKNFYFNNINEIFIYNQIDYKEKKNENMFFNISELIPNFYKNYVDKNIKTKYVILSISVLSGSLKYIKALLEAGKKVVVGGAGANFAFPNSIRKVLIDELNVDSYLVENNIIFVVGYLDLNLDFYKIIKEWKDLYIKYDINSLLSIFDISEDYLSSFYDEQSYISLFFSLGCNWGNCRHCWMSSKRKMIDKVCSFVDNEKYLVRIKNYFGLCKKLYPKTNKLLFADSYPTFRSLSFLKLLDISNFESIVLWSSIQQLKNESYVDLLFQLNKNITISIGIDYLNDFSLSFMNKGYKKKDIFLALNIIEKYKNIYKNNVSIRVNYITDYPFDFKFRREEDFETIDKIRSKLENCGIKFVLMKYGQMIFKNSFLDNNESKYYKITKSHYDQNVSGLFSSIGKRMRNNNISEVQFFCQPYIRYDKYGNIIPSEYNK